MEEIKKRNFLSRIKENIKKIAEKFNEMLEEEDYSELNAEQRKELEEIKKVQIELHGGRDFIPTAEVDEKTAQKTAEGKTVKRRSKVLGDE